MELELAPIGHVSNNGAFGL